MPEVWKNSPGSSRLTLMDNRVFTLRLVDINPLSDTVAGRKSECDDQGRRFHFNELFQIVMLLKGTVRYRNEKNGKGDLHEARDLYPTVKPNGEGTWHTHNNPSDTDTARILVFVFHKPPFPKQRRG